MSTAGPEPNSSHEEQLWREIVENYGDRIDLEPAESPIPAITPAPDPTPESADDVWDEDEHYRPPPPPPVEYPTGPRAMAWFGIYGGPTVLLLLVLFKVHIPAWAGWFTFFGFVGGFGYLVATMRTDEDDWGDGTAI